MAGSVADLLTTPFLNRPLEDQQQIVARGRPIQIKNLTMVSNPTNQRDPSNPLACEQVPWVTYCMEMRKIFCWTCLLFMPSSAMVTRKVNADLNEILTITNNHEATEKHLECTLRLQTFISQNFKTSVPVGDKKIEYNYTVIRCREILKRIVDAVCCAAGQKQFASHGKYSFNLIDVGECKNFLLLLKSCDQLNADIVDGAVDLLSRSPRIVNDLVDAITRVVKMNVKNETHKSTYVSLILSEHGTSTGTSQISSVLRYINRGKACERFIGFTNVVDGRHRRENAEILLLIQNTIKEYGIPERYLAFSVDGEILPKEALITLITCMTTDFQFSYFVPWHSHGFGYVLLQTLSTVGECGFFLKTINAIQNFFRSEKNFKSFEFLLSEKIPDYSQSPSIKWNLHANFIIYVCKYRIYFKEFFENIIKNSKYWDTGALAKAIAFRSFLEKVRNIFLLQVFFKIFSEDFDENFNFLPANEEDMCAFKNPRITEFQNKVCTLEFASVWKDLDAEADEEGQDSKSKLIVNDKARTELLCEILFKTIIRNLGAEIEIRIKHLINLKFCDMFYCDPTLTAATYQFNLMLKTLMYEHGPFFKRDALETEMVALKANEILRNKSVCELLEYFAEFNLRSIFPQLFKLAEFILTLPFLPVCGNKDISKLKDIKDYAYIPEKTGIPSGEASVICVEYEMVRTLKDSVLFYDDVLARFYEVNKTLPLVQV